MSEFQLFVCAAIFTIAVMTIVRGALGFIISCATVILTTLCAWPYILNNFLN